MKPYRLLSQLLIVLTLAMSPVYATSVLTTASDSVNSGILNTKLYTNDKLSKTDVDATVVNGVAVFSGTVNTKAQLDELVRLGHSISGVKGVDVSKVKVVGK